MAGAGRKVFTPGEILRAADVNGFLMDQAVMVFDDATERDLALGTAVVSQGMVSYLKDVDELEVYTSDWERVFPSVANTGEIIQVVSNVRSSVFSQSLAASAISADALTATITPTSTSSKILVLVQFSGTVTTASGMHVYLYRNGSITNYVGDASSSRGRGVGSIPGAIVSAVATFLGSLNYLDSPASVSALTYSIRLGHVSTETQTVHLNRSSNDSDNTQQIRGASSMTLLEVAG